MSFIHVVSPDRMATSDWPSETEARRTSVQTTTFHPFLQGARTTIEYSRNTDHIQRPEFIIHVMNMWMEFFIHPSITIQVVGPLHLGLLIGSFENPLYT